MTWMGSELGLLRSQRNPQDEEATFVDSLLLLEWVSFKTSFYWVAASTLVPFSFSDVFG